MKKEIYYQIFKNNKAKETLVLLHGFLESSTMWSPIVPYLTLNHNLITIDLPGFGKSKCKNTVHTMEFFAQTVKEVLDQEGTNTCIVLGHSMGGYVALAFAELYPDTILKLILLNSSTLADSEARKLQRDQAVKLANQNKERYVSLAISNLFTETAKKQFPEAIKKLKKEAKSFELCGITAALQGMKLRKDRTKLVKSLDCPKILIAGKQDLLIPYDTSKQLAKKANLDLFSLSGGHMGMIENFNEILKIFPLIDILCK